MLTDENAMYSISYFMWCQIRCKFVVKQPLQKISALIASISKCIDCVYIKVHWLRLYQSALIASISKCIDCVYIKVHWLRLYQSALIASISKCIDCVYIKVIEDRIHGQMDKMSMNQPYESMCVVNMLLSTGCPPSPQKKKPKKTNPFLQLN